MDDDGHLTSSRYFDAGIDTLLTKVYRSWWRFFFWVLTICIGSFFIGYTNRIQILLSFKSPSLPHFLIFILNFGSYSIFAFLGALSCYFFIKKLSQRMTLCLASFIGIVGSLIHYVGYMGEMDRHITLKLVGKIVQGFAGGMFSVYVPSVIKDIVPIEESVTFGSFHQLFIVFGLFVSKLFDLLIALHYREADTTFKQLPILFPIPFLILMILLICLHYKTQTPKYLIQNKKKEEAKRLIEHLYRSSVSEQIYLQIEYSVNAMDNSYLDGDFDMKTVRKRIIIIGIGVAVIQQMSGASIVNTYGLYPYNQQYQSKVEENIKFMLVWCSIQIFVVLVLILLNSLRNSCGQREIKCLKVISKRRNLFRIGIMVTILLEIAIVIASGKERYFEALKYILYVFAANYGLTLGPMTWIYLSEISDIFEMTSALLFSWLFSFITTTLIPQLPGITTGEVQNLSTGLLSLALLNVICYLLAQKYLVETKYKSDIEIYRELSALNFDRCCWNRRREIEE